MSLENGRPAPVRKAGRPPAAVQLVQVVLWTLPDLCLDLMDVAFDLAEMAAERVGQQARPSRIPGRALAAGAVKTARDLALDLKDVAFELGEWGVESAGQLLASARLPGSSGVRGALQTVTDLGLDLLDMAAELIGLAVQRAGQLVGRRPSHRPQWSPGGVRAAGEIALDAVDVAIERAERGWARLQSGQLALPRLSAPSLSANTLSTALLAAGIVLFGYAAALQLELVSEVRLPSPVAMDSGRASAGERWITLAEPGGRMSADQAADMEEADAELVSEPAAPKPLAVRPSQPRAQGPNVDTSLFSAPGVAETLSIPAIGLNTSVTTAGVSVDPRTGQPEWETKPFVAVHYADNTALVGARGNAVLAGHVVTISEGNVFRDLYRVLPGDRVFVKVHGGETLAYQVRKVGLAPPNAVEVMPQTADPELTLITCGGTFDPRTRTFSQRLVVVAKLIGTAA